LNFYKKLPDVLLNLSKRESLPTLKRFINYASVWWRLWHWKSRRTGCSSIDDTNFILWQLSFDWFVWMLEFYFRSLSLCNLNGIFIDDDYYEYRITEGAW